MVNMNFDDVETFGARTEVALENAYDEVEQAVSDVAVSDHVFEDVQDAYNEAVEKYGEATEHAYIAARTADQSSFGHDEAEVTQAVEHMLHSRDIVEEARTAASRMLRIAHENVPEVSRPQGTNDNGFPVTTPEDRLHEARNYVNDARQNYAKAASEVERGISNEADLDYSAVFGFSETPEEFQQV